MADLIRFEDTVSYLLAKVSTAFRTSLERHMAFIDLHSGQIFLLIELWKKDGQRQIDLAKSLDLAAPTVNKTIGGLIEVGLVTRERIDDDARSTRIYLTDSGRGIRREIETRWIELEGDCLGPLTETERLVIIEVLGKLRIKFTGRSALDDDE
jgi:DNA-binding MarR family transcriptional regulator